MKGDVISFYSVVGVQPFLIGIGVSKNNLVDVILLNIVDDVNFVEIFIASDVDVTPERNHSIVIGETTFSEE